MKQMIFYTSSAPEEEEPEGHYGCSSFQVWALAQELAQNHTYSLGNQLYAFPSRRFFDQKFKEINKEILEKHLFANKYTKTLSDYKERRCLWIYDHRKDVSNLC